MSPKKLLRLPEAKSSFDEMLEGNITWWMDGWLNVCIIDFDQWMDALIDALTDGNELMIIGVMGWIKEWMDGWMDGQMDGWSRRQSANLMYSFDALTLF